MADETVALCEQYGVPIQGALMFLEKFSEVFKILATIHPRSKILEDEGIARRGFAADLQAMILRHLTQFLQARPQERS
jgi:hypothetical protein